MSLAERLPALARFIAEHAQATQARIVHCQPLTGGAIQENWVLEVELPDGPLAGQHALVLRTDAPSRVAASHSRAEEFALLRTAHKAGVAVPEPLWLATDPAVLGKPFFLMRHVAGVAAGHKLVKDPGFPIDRARLTQRLGQELAKIHALSPLSARPRLSRAAEPPSGARSHYRIPRLPRCTRRGAAGARIWARLGGAPHA
jgi:aminoglycoside phosphotransferase (APT) family kinase protein